jgi:hypothetical protein
MSLFFHRSSNRSLDYVDAAGGGDDDCAGSSKANGIPDWEDPLRDSGLVSVAGSGSSGLPAEVGSVQSKKTPWRSSSGKLRRRGSVSSRNHASMRHNSNSSNGGLYPSPSSDNNNADNNSHPHRQQHLPPRRQPSYQGDAPDRGRHQQQHEDHSGQRRETATAPPISRSRRLEDMVIECDPDVEHSSVGDITYDGSVMYDYGHQQHHQQHHPSHGGQHQQQSDDKQPYRPDHHRRGRRPTAAVNPVDPPWAPPRSSSGLARADSRRPPAMTTDNNNNNNGYMRRETSERHVVRTNSHRQDDRDQGEMSLEEEERRLIELAMERSLQETSSNNAFSFQDSANFDNGSSSRGGGSQLRSASLSGDAAGRPPDRPGFVWQREGKKWLKVPVAASSSDGLRAMKVGNVSRRQHSSSEMSRAERLEQMEQELLEEAMQRSICDLKDDQSHNLSGHSGSGQFSDDGRRSQHSAPRGMRSTSRNTSNMSLLSNGGHRSFCGGSDSDDDNDDDANEYVDDDDDQAMLARLRELEEEKARLKMAIKRRSSFGKKSSHRSRTSTVETVSVHSDDLSSLPRRSGHKSNDPHYGDVPRYNNDITVYDDGDHHHRHHHSHHDSNNAHHRLRHHHHQQYQEEAYDDRPYHDDQDQYDDDPHHHSGGGSGSPLRPLRVSRSASTDSTERKMVWKKGPRGVWGRFDDHSGVDAEEEDEESIMADVLKRSLKDL